MVRQFNDQTQGPRWVNNVKRELSKKVWVNNAKFGGKCVNSSLGAVLTWP